MYKSLEANEALPSVLLKASAPSYMPEEPFAISPEAFYFCEDTCLNDSFSENENSSDVEKWEFVRVFLSQKVISIE